MSAHTAVVERLSALLEEELPEEETLELRSHLEGCDECRASFEALRQTTEALRALRPHAAPPDLEARIRRRMRRRAVIALPRPSAWPQELLSAAVLAIIVGATVTLSGRILAPPAAEEGLSAGPTATGLFGDQLPASVEVRFAAGDETAARAVVAAAADLGARTLSGAPVRPGEPLPAGGMAFSLPREALAVIVPDGIASVIAVPEEAAHGSEEPRAPLAPGWIRVRVRVGVSGP